MANPIQKVDEFFAAFIDDEATRFFVMHLPFWSFVVYIVWHLTENLGLYLLWAGTTFVVVPYVVAQVLVTIYSDEQIRQDGIGQWRPPWAWICGYVVLILVLIGIPGLYFGYAIQFVQSKMFNKFYWGFVALWWKAFNFYHDYKAKELNEFLQGFSFRYLTWAWSFMVSAVVIVPGMFYWLYATAKENFQAEELEESRLVEKDRALKLQEEAQAKEAQRRQLVFEEKKRQEELAQKEKQRKLQEKMNEIKGKDPWESGFL